MLKGQKGQCNVETKPEEVVKEKHGCGEEERTEGKQNRNRTNGKWGPLGICNSGQSLVDIRRVIPTIS